MFTFSNFRKSTGSGELLQHAPNVCGYSVASQSEDHPPDECPVTIRPLGSVISLNRDSIAGISSSTSARPQGPFTSESQNSVWPLPLSGSRKIQNVLFAICSA